MATEILTNLVRPSLETNHDRLFRDTQRIVDEIRAQTGEFDGALPESQRESFLALADGGAQRKLLRRILEGVVDIVKEQGKLYEIRSDGEMNFIEGGVLHTTEKPENPAEGVEWQQRMIPSGEFRMFRVRGQA